MLDKERLKIVVDGIGAGIIIASVCAAGLMWVYSVCFK